VAEHRAGQHEASLRSLNMATILARALGEHETEIGASLLLSVTHLVLGEAEQGLRVINDVIHKCETKGDFENLANAYANRCDFWSHYKQLDRAKDDIEKCRAIAEEHGFFHMELVALFNLAELLLRIGDTTGALQATREAYRQNQSRFKENPLVIINLLHAHVLCHAGAFAEANQVLNESKSKINDEPQVKWLARTVEVAAGNGAGNWDDLFDYSKDKATPEQYVQTLWLRARCAKRAGYPEARLYFQSAIEHADRIDSQMAVHIQREMRGEAEKSSL
jgi:tetratricopeptide (TPR) repeat protein